jgi:hypothetical protein
MRRFQGFAVNLMTQPTTCKLHWKPPVSLSGWKARPKGFERAIEALIGKPMSAGPGQLNLGVAKLEWSQDPMQKMLAHLKYEEQDFLVLSCLSSGRPARLVCVERGPPRYRLPPKVQTNSLAFPTIAFALHSHSSSSSAACLPGREFRRSQLQQVSAYGRTLRAVKPTLTVRGVKKLHK